MQDIELGCLEGLGFDAKQNTRMQIKPVVYFQLETEGQSPAFVKGICGLMILHSEQLGGKQGHLLSRYPAEQVAIVQSWYTSKKCSKQACLPSS